MPFPCLKDDSFCRFSFELLSGDADRKAGSTSLRLLPGPFNLLTHRTWQSPSPRCHTCSNKHFCSDPTPPLQDMFRVIWKRPRSSNSKVSLHFSSVSFDLWFLPSALPQDTTQLLHHARPWRIDTLLPALDLLHLLESWMMGPVASLRDIHHLLPPRPTEWYYSARPFTTMAPERHP